MGVQLGLDGAHHPKPFSTAPPPRATGTPFQNTAESLLCWDSGWLFYQVEDLSVHGPLLILTTLQKFEASVQNIYFQPKQGGYWGPQVVLIYVCGSRELHMGLPLRLSARPRPCALPPLPGAGGLLPGYQAPASRA